MNNAGSDNLNAYVSDIVPKPWLGKKPSPYDELGKTGLIHYSGQIFEELLPELQGDRGRKLIRQMIDEDSTIGAMLFAIEMLVRQVKWDVAPADDSPQAAEVAEFVKGCLFEDMENTWPDTLSEILTMLPWGWAFLEVVYKPRRGVQRDNSLSSKYDDGRIGFKKWAMRSQETLYSWMFDDSGTPVALQQLPPPTWTIRTIPLEKGLLFRTSVRKNNPEGRPIFRNAHRAWYIKRNLENIEAIGIERDLAGLPVIYVPEELLSPNATPAQKAALAVYKKIVTSIKRDEQEGLVLPSKRDSSGNLIYDLKLLTTGGARSFDTDRVIQRYDQRIAIVALADFILLGHTQHTGSFGLGVNKSDLFSTALSAYLDSICATINRQGIPKLCEINNFDLKLAPQLTHGKVKELSLQEVVDFMVAATGVGITFTEEDGDKVKEMAGMAVSTQANADKKAATLVPLAARKVEPNSALQQAEPPKSEPKPEPEAPPKEQPQPRKNDELKRALKQASESDVPDVGEIQATWEWLTDLLPPDEKEAQ